MEAVTSCFSKIKFSLLQQKKTELFSLPKFVNFNVLSFSSLEQYKEFQEECYSIALHPSGLYILVGFSDKLRLMNLLIDDIRSFKEFTIRGCREVGVNSYERMSLFNQ